MQNQTLSDPTEGNAALKLEAQRKWQILIKVEESFLCQRSKVTWVKEEDMNSAYFHRMVATRKTINHIHYLIAADGSRIETQKEISEHCVEYFSELLGSEQEPQMLIQEDMDLLLPYRCSQAQKISLEKQFTKEEIRSAFFSLPRNKTCEPDGFPAEFFTGCWSIIGPEVTEAVEEFFSSGIMLKQWNATNLVLIPKISNASSTSDFRPISCLNTIYKVISKLLASRLQLILTQVISLSQSAFMRGRLLGENILLATELVHGYNKRNIELSAMH